jgi:opacity protein-like surface antigen
VYGKGDYKFNSRLTLTGSFIKNFSDQSNNTLQNRAWNNSFQMMSMGLNYKLSENVTIGAGFRFMQTDGYYYNPLLYHTSPVNSDYFSNF